LPLGSLVYRRLDNSLLDRLDSISKQGRAYSVNIKNIDISKNETKRIDIPMEMIDYYKDTGEFLIKRSMLVYLSDDYDATSDSENGSITNEIIDFQNILKSYNLPVIFITRDLEFKSIMYSSIVRYLDVD
jgi:hypothetical protein